jgi:hypothetical protein
LGSLTLLLFLASSLGCRAFDEGLLDGGGTTDAPSSGCPLHKPPPRPTTEDSTSIDTLLYAIKDVLLEQEGIWGIHGYDLDDRCSTESNGDVECRAPSSAPPEVDGFGGTDNALGHNVLPLVLSVMPTLQAHARQGLSQGLGTILLRVEEWNGTSNDPRVVATFMQAKFGAAEPFPDPIETVSVQDFGLVINGMTWPVPDWDGGDVFWARPDNFLGGDLSRPLIMDDNAYVANDTLVMRLPDRFPFALSGDETGVEFALTDVTFTVELDGDHRRVRDAVIAGRYPVTDILLNADIMGICPGTSDYMTFERLLDLAADIRTVPGSGGPSATCDAVSMGLTFETGIVATLAGALEPFPTPDPCATP